LDLIALYELHDVIDAFTTALDAKNSYTWGHSTRVAEYSLLIAEYMGLSIIEQQRIHIGAHLHDIGKLSIPDAILNKPGKLTQDEFAIIRQHPTIGNNMISKVKCLASIADIVHHHHERFDGKGYPDGLWGEEISLGARIVAVADSFDAMTTQRTYRLAFNTYQALEEIEICRGSQFDPDVVDVFMFLMTENKLKIKENIQIKKQLITA